MKLFKIKRYIILYTVRTNNLFLILFVKIKVLVAYAVPKNYVVVKLLIIQMYTALFPFDYTKSPWEVNYNKYLY